MELSLHWESAKKVAVVAAAMVMVVAGGWAAGPWLILSLLCVCKCCAHVTTSAHSTASLGALVSRFHFPWSTSTVFPRPQKLFALRVVCLTQLTKTAWILVSEAFLPFHILFSPHYSLTYLTGHRVKGILFGPFQTARLADWKHSAPVTSREFGSLLKWSF